MKKFDENYVLLEEMARDGYFPGFLVEKVENLIKPIITMLEDGETNDEVIQERLDDMTMAINDLQEEFEENGSEIETVARDSIAATVGYILDYFDVDIDVETALRERDW